MVVVAAAAVVVVQCSGTCSCSCSCSCLSIYLTICKLEKEAIPREFLSFYLNFTRSKTQQFCETSSIFAFDNIKKRSNSARIPHFSKLTASETKQFCETFFKNGECRADGLVPMGFGLFPLHLSKVLRLPRKSEARSYEVLHLSRKIIFPKLKIRCSKI